jgi:osmotically-inducible protein OsmY
MKTLIVLIILIAGALAAYWFLGSDENRASLQRAEEQVARRAEQAKETIQDKLEDWSLSTTNIRDELERTGKVVRKKAREIGAVVADAAADARVTTTIKAKLVKEPDLSALKISVDTTDGVVTLSGSVSSPEDVKRAMELALETDGVREVISTLQVKANK